MSGHWPGEVLLSEMRGEFGSVVRGMPFYGGGVFDLLGRVWPEEKSRDPGAFGHGVMWETSCMLALREDWVDLERVPRIRSSAFRSQLQQNSDEILAGIAEANAASGNRFFDDAAAELARIARGLSSSCTAAAGLAARERRLERARPGLEGPVSLGQYGRTEPRGALSPNRMADERVEETVWPDFESG